MVGKLKTLFDSLIQYGGAFIIPKILKFIPILGIIPEDDAIRKSQALKNAVIHTHPRSKAAKTYFNISKRILGEDVDFVDPKNLGLVGRFLQSIGLR